MDEYIDDYCVLYTYISCVTLNEKYNLSIIVYGKVYYIIIVWYTIMQDVCIPVRGENTIDPEDGNIIPPGFKNFSLAKI